MTEVDLCALSTTKVSVHQLFTHHDLSYLTWSLIIEPMERHRVFYKDLMVNTTCQQAGLVCKKSTKQNVKTTTGMYCMHTNELEKFL